MGFHEDLAKGKEAEYKALKAIQKKYPKALIIEGEFKEFDIFVPEIRRAIEVKCDIKAAETGNVFVEIKFGRHYSGLITTTADLWLFYLHEGVYWIKPEHLKILILKYGLHQVHHSPDGSNGEGIGYLVKKTMLNEYSTLIPHRSEDESVRNN